MTCPESRAGQWQLTRKALVATRSLAFWWGLFLFGAQWGREGEEDPSSARARASPGVDAASSLRVLLGRHPPADRKADEPFPYPEDSSPATGSESNFSSQNIPAAKSHSQTSQKKKKKHQPPCPELDVTDPSLLFRSQHSNGFCSLFLYKHKLFKSHKMTVNFSNQVPITCMIFVYALVHYACANEG